MIRFVRFLKISFLSIIALLALAACQISASPTLPRNETKTNATADSDHDIDNSSAETTLAPTVLPLTDPFLTPTPTMLPDPTATPKIQPTRIPTVTAAPTATIAPTATVAPTAKPTVAATPKPTRAPTPTATKAPTPTLKPTATPAPAGIVINLPGVPVNWPLSASQQSRVDQFIKLVNQARAAEGIAPLATGSSDLRHMAAIRAAEISIKFSHDRPTTLENSLHWWHLLKALHISYLSAGENITGGPSTPEAALETFMNSSGHRGNILNPGFKKIAIGVYTDSSGKDWWVQEFIG